MTIDSSTWIVRSSVRDSEPEGGAGLSLVVLGEGLLATHSLPATGSVLIGRSASCDIPISDRSISRRHAVLHVGEQLLIEDLASTNGTRVAGNRIPAGAPTHIRRGEPVELGAVSILLQRRTVAPPPSPPAHAAPELDALYPGDAERERIIEALEVCRGNQTRAAAMLGMSRRTLISRIERYRLPRPRKRGTRT
ncbi:MAG TPA: FHA domain-containing protein [Kofleriaceae bacterium]|nr:FHA domain-containing protein [Kofleriaceae bacterium]